VITNNRYNADIVVVHSTSVAYVNSEGSPVPPPDGSEGDDDDGGSGKTNLGKALGIGLGVGIPTVLVAAGIVAWVLIRRHKQRSAGFSDPQHAAPAIPGGPTGGVGGGAVAATDSEARELHSTSTSPLSRIDRKPVATFTAPPPSALDEKDTSELQGREFHHLSDHSPPTASPGTDELRHWPLAGQPAPPSAELTGVEGYRGWEMADTQRRSELA
jgi:hypothetical protein